MRICDRCGNKLIAKRWIEQITHEERDLCHDCSVEFDEFLNVLEQEKRKPGRPRKDGTE